MSAPRRRPQRGPRSDLPFRRRRRRRIAPPATARPPARRRRAAHRRRSRGRRRRLRVRLLVRPLGAPRGQDRAEHVRLRRRRLAPRLDPGRAQPAGRAARERQRRGCRRRRSRSRTGASTRTAGSTRRASRAPSSPTSKARSVVQGGSTITQQLVRNLYISNERTVQRKLKEACLALKLNDAWSKERILESYLNQVYYGNLAYGIEAAAQTYFSKPARSLNLRESALLAGLTQAPSAYDPFVEPAKALARRNAVLDAMRDQGVITAKQYRWARRLARPPAQARAPLQGDPRAVLLRLRPRPADPQVRRRDRALRRPERLHDDPPALAARGAGRDPGDAHRAGRSGRSGDLDRSRERRHPRDDGRRSRAAATTSSTSSRRRGGSRARRSRRSCSRPRSRRASIRTRATTSRRRSPTGPSPNGNCEDGSWWCVKTYDSTYNGWTSISRATLRSDNAVYAQLTLDVGPEQVGEMARKLGVRSPLEVGGQYVPAMGLGSVAVSPLDMASAYATLAAGGIYSEPTAIRKVVLPNGKEDTKAGWGTPKRTRVIPDGVAWKVTEILEDNVSYGTGVRAAFGRPAAGKTGTTDKHADAWFVGYTPDLATAVWMGYAGRRDPDGERPRHRRLRRQLPRRDLAAADGAHDRAAARRGSSPTRRPTPSTSPSSAARWRSATTRTTSRRRPRTETDDDRDDADTRRRRRRRGARRRRRRSREARASRSGGRGVARARRRRLRARLAARLAARPASRRQRLGHGAARSSSLLSRRSPPTSSRSPLLRRVPPSTRAVDRARRRDPARARSPRRCCSPPTRGRTGRTAGSARRSDGNPYSDPPESSRTTRRSTAWAAPGSTRRASTAPRSRSPRSRSRSSPATRTRVAAWSYKALAAAAALAAALLAGRLARRRAFAIAFVGWNPLLAVHLAGGGHNDAWVGALILAALALSASRRAAGGGRALGARDRGQVGADRSSSPCARSRRGRPVGRTASAASSVAAAGSRSARRCSTAAPGRSRSSPRRQRRARDELRDPAPAGAARAARTASRSALAVAALRGRARLARSARRAAAARGSASPPVSCS